MFLELNKSIMVERTGLLFLVVLSAACVCGARDLANPDLWTNNTTTSDYSGNVVTVIILILMLIILPEDMNRVVACVSCILQNHSD